MAEQAEQSIGEWLAFWVQIFVLGLLAILGVVFAADGGAPGDYDTGLILTIASAVLLCLRLKYRFDGGPLGWQQFLLVDRVAALAVVVPVFVAIALGGLLLAAALGEGSLHDAGIGLFVVSGIAVFLSLKRVFDALDRHR